MTDHRDYEVQVESAKQERAVPDWERKSLAAADWLDALLKGLPAFPLPQGEACRGIGGADVALGVIDQLRHCIARALCVTAADAGEDVRMSGNRIGKRQAAELLAAAAGVEAFPQGACHGLEQVPVPCELPRPVVRPGRRLHGNGAGMMPRHETLEQRPGQLLPEYDRSRAGNTDRQRVVRKA